MDMKGETENEMAKIAPHALLLLVTNSHRAQESNNTILPLTPISFAFVTLVLRRVNSY